MNIATKSILMSMTLGLAACGQIAPTIGSATMRFPALDRASVRASAQ